MTSQLPSVEPSLTKIISYVKLLALITTSNPCVQLWQALFFVVEWYYNRNVHVFL